MRMSPSRQTVMRLRRFAPSVVAVCFSAVVVLQVVCYLFLDGNFPEFLALSLVGVGVAGVSVWIWCQRKVPHRVSAQSLKAGSVSDEQIRLLKRRSLRVNSLIVLGSCAAFAVLSGTVSDDPEWRAFAEGDLEIRTVDVGDVTDVSVVNGRRGTSYTYEFSGTVPTGDGPVEVASAVSGDLDPRDGQLGDLVFALYDPDELDNGIVFSTSRSELRSATTLPTEPFMALGGYVIVALATLAFCVPGGKRVELYRIQGALWSYSGEIARKDLWWKLFTGFLGSLGLVLYALSALRVFPGGFIRPGEIYGDVTYALAVYAALMLVISTWIGTRFGTWAIGEGRIVFNIRSTGGGPGHPPTH